MALLNPPLHPPFSKGGTGGIFADALLKIKKLRNMAAFFQTAKVLPEFCSIKIAQNAPKKPVSCCHPNRSKLQVSGLMRVGAGLKPAPTEGP
jgi:hypothetical protein